MMIEKGMVARATAGKECGGLFVVTGVSDKYVFIADGRKRKLSSPKRKSLKHLRFTDNIIDINDITDKKLRNVLGNPGTP